MKTNLRALIGDALRAQRNRKLEMTDDGRVYLPGARAFLGGVIQCRYCPPGEDAFGPATSSCNRVVNEGLNHFLNLLGGHDSAVSLYLAPFTGNVAPAANWTGANFAANATEFTAYSSATRLPWTTVPSTAQSLGNAAALAVATLTFNAGGPYTVRGIGLLQSQAKSATTGKLIMAGRFENDLTGMMGGGKLALEYDIQALDESDA